MQDSTWRCTAVRFSCIWDVERPQNSARGQQSLDSFWFFDFQRPINHRLCRTSRLGPYYGKHLSVSQEGIPEFQDSGGLARVTPRSVTVVTATANLASTKFYVHRHTVLSCQVVGTRFGDHAEGDFQWAPLAWGINSLSNLELQACGSPLEAEMD